MAQALDSEFAWGIDPLNRGQLSPQQLTGLQALVPTGGLGLARPTEPVPIGGAADNFPTPGFSPQGSTDAFNFIEPRVVQAVQNLNYGIPLFNSGIGNQGEFGDVLVNPNGPQPYFDPNFPNESMVALRDYLAPKMAAGADASQRARGLDYTGTGVYGQREANDYLNSIAPFESGPQAFSNDIERLYGPGVLNSLTEGSTHQAGFGPYVIDPSLPKGTPTAAGGSPVGQYAFVGNPNYVSWPSGPPENDGLPNNSGGGTGIRPLGLNALAAGGSAVPTPDASLQPWQQPYVPQYGLFDFASDNALETPGYFYSPQLPFDASRRPWLQNATRPTAPKAPPPPSSSGGPFTTLPIGGRPPVAAGGDPRKLFRPI